MCFACFFSVRALSAILPLLHTTVPPLKVLKEHSLISYDWSYVVAWVGVGWSLVSAILFSAAAICLRGERMREEAMNMQYLMPGITCPLYTSVALCARFFWTRSRKETSPAGGFARLGKSPPRATPCICVPARTDGNVPAMSTGLCRFSGVLARSDSDRDYGEARLAELSRSGRA